MRLSLFQRLLAPLIPLIIVVAIVIFIANRALNGSTQKLMGSVQTLEDGFQALLYAGEMSDAMKGFMLNPSNDSEKQRKIRADEKLQELMTAIKKRNVSPELLSALQRLSDADENELNPFENEIAALIERGKTQEALLRFQKEYAGKRSNYDSAVTDLLKVAKAEAHAEASAIDSSMKTAFVEIAAGLTLGMIGIVAFLGWLATTLSRRLGVLTTRFTTESDSVTMAARQILDTSQSLAQAVSEQSAALQETVASVEEINAMVARNASNAQKTKETVEASRHKFDTGKVAVQELHRNMDHIQTTNDQVVTQMERNNAEFGDIVKVISEIGDKTRIINDIVFQTKLLSFNASVEAARAGEHGKGFAVVAEEVGNLAQMSGNAAKEISSMLETSVKRVKGIMEKRSEEATALVSTTKATLEAGASSTRKCGDAFDSVMSDAGEINSLMQEITAASTEQAQGLSEVTRAMGQLDQVTQQNNSVAQRASNLAQALARQAETLKTMTKDLTVMVQGDQNGVHPRPEAKLTAAGPRTAATAAAPSKPETTATPAPKAAAPTPKKKKATKETVTAASEPKPAPVTTSSSGSVPSSEDQRFIDL
ncbi:MAG: methyl-accepting chemotaxis protein [Oligoflexia bacterium]|nr:methyl-accepting chemotaxis protein [Oligoflexia bacterium]